MRKALVAPVGRHGNSSARPGVGTLDTRRRRRRRPNPKGAERSTPGRPACQQQLVQIPRDSNFRSRFTGYGSIRGFVRATMETETETERQFYKFGLLRANAVCPRKERRSIAFPPGLWTPPRTIRGNKSPCVLAAVSSIRALSKSPRFRSSRDIVTERGERKTHRESWIAKRSPTMDFADSCCSVPLPTPIPLPVYLEFVFIARSFDSYFNWSRARSVSHRPRAMARGL